MNRFIRKSWIAVLSCVLLFHVNIIAFAETENTDALEEVSVEVEGKQENIDIVGEVYKTVESKYISSISNLLVLESYSISDNRLVAGNDSVITLRISNVNHKMNATNVVITISDDSNVFLPQEGTSNQFFVDFVAAGTQKEVEIPISVAEGTLGNHYLNIRIDYSYLSDGIIYGGFNNQVRINFPVYLSSIITDSMILSSDPSAVDIKLTNSGSRDIYNVTAHLSGDISGTENIYIGNVEAGKEIETKVPISFLSSGNKNIKVFYSYKNDRGISIQSDEESFLLTVSEEAFNGLENDSNNSESKLSVSFIIIEVICIALIAISLCFGFFVMKKKRLR